jgi:alpha-galactosidase
MLNYTISTMNSKSTLNLETLPTAYALRLSGKLNGGGFPPSSVWRQARPVRFDQDWRGKNRDKLRTTEVRLLWKLETFFLRFAARYRTISVYSDAREDGWRYELWEKDVAEAFLQPDTSDPFEYQELEVAPNGFWIDLHISHGKNRELHSGLQRRATLDPATKIWTVEVAVPMKSLTDHFDPSHSWRANFFRVEGRQEPRFYSAWNATRTEKPNFHVPAAFGHLVFVK